MPATRTQKQKKQNRRSEEEKEENQLQDVLAQIVRRLDDMDKRFEEVQRSRSRASSRMSAVSRVPSRMSELPHQQVQEVPMRGSVEESYHSAAFERPVPARASSILGPAGDGETKEQNSVSSLVPRLDYFVARQTEGKDLPRFSGEPTEYPNFISHFKRSTEICGYSDGENLGRLQKCLHGKAREAVYALLALPESVPKILKILENRFGRPEMVISDLAARLLRLPSINENDFAGIIAYSSEIQNYVTTVHILDRPDYLIEPSMLKSCVGKLPPSLRILWGKFVARNLNNVTRIDKFSAWLEDEVEGLSVIAHEESSYSGQTKNFPTSCKGRNDSASRRNGQPKVCKFCSIDAHDLGSCSKWLTESVAARWVWVSKFRLCYKCLKPFHSAPSCRIQQNCTNCNGQHHVTLHKPDQSSETRVSSQRSNIHSEAASSSSQLQVDDYNAAHENQKWATLLRVLPVKLFGPKGSVDTFALLDDGSTVTLLEASLARQIGVSGPVKPLSLAWSGQMIRVEEESEVVNLEISGSAENSRKFKLFNARTVGELHLAPQSFDLNKIVETWPFVGNGEVTPLLQSKPQIIVGQDNWPLLKSRKSFSGPWKGPVVTHTWLGWVLSGNVPQRATSAHFNVGSHQQLCHWENVEKEEDNDWHKMVENRLFQDNFLVNPTTRKVTVEEEKALEIFNATTRYLPDTKRWETGLLWKVKGELPESRAMAEARFRALERRFRRDPVFAKTYCVKMEENFDKGYARALTQQELKEDVPRVWYLPHMGVINPNKPGKLRICFDASAKSQGMCFNDFIYTGSDLYVSISGLLLKFRQHAVAFTGDIKEMFPQVRIKAEDQHAQRFLWRGLDSSKPVRVCVMQSMLFGSVCSPFAAQEIRNRNALRFSEQYPRAVKAIAEKHYMDDYVESVSTEEEGIKLLQEVRDIHKEGGFLLCAITSNSEKIIESVPPELRAESVVKILGLLWDSNSDELGFSHLWKRIKNEIGTMGKNGLTKRNMLRQVMRVYDPLGMLQNFIIQARILLQELWQEDLHWDDKVPQTFCIRWQDWVTRLGRINDLKIPRWYTPMGSDSDIEMHVFCDASEQAYAAVVYLRFAKGNEVEVKFLMGKAQVAPTKTVTIPRLELRAAVIATRLTDFCTKTLDYDLKKATLWSDSKVVLSWIRSRRKKFKTFVANHVSEILDTTKEDQWRWVPTALNPADQATRWKLETLTIESQWSTGPEFLRFSEDKWPTESFQSVSDDVLEVREVNCHTSERWADFMHPIELPEASRYSKWTRLIGVTGWVIRYITNLKRVSANRRELVQLRKIPEPLTCEERETAERLWCRKVQQDSFLNEIKQLCKYGNVDSKSRLARLDVYLDLERKIVRSRGRIDAANVPDDVKRPVVLDRHHHFTRLLIMETHERMFHQGRETVLNELRQKYWIVQGRKAVRDTIKTCQACRKMKSKTTKEREGDLPEERLAHHVRPFTNVGVDYFGPMLVSVGRRCEKRYGVIFTCMVTRAVHLELAHDLSTDSAIMAIRRLSARRGAPSKLFSDNGTNLRGADAELQRCLSEWNQYQIVSTLANRGIAWQFNPPAAPHMGGCWERLIRSVKGALKAVLHSKTPKEEVLQTFLAEVEGILNSRPLTEVSGDAGDREALTPNHFLIGGASLKPLIPPIPEGVCLKRAWRISQQMADEFWGRWTKEYLPTLFQRSNLGEARRKMNVGDTVLIVEQNAERGKWPMGVIQATYPGKDGRVRVVDVRTKSGVFRRHISKLCPLAEGEL